MEKLSPTEFTMNAKAVILTILILLLGGSSTVAQDISSGSDSDILPYRQGPSDPQELEIFIDGIMADQMETYHIPGATISVVKDGELLFAKGYGYSNLEEREPVIANKTLFRVGSISKVFTWTALMQLAEAGRIDINADVNTYLTDLTIPDTYPDPITPAHLMTHTAGFEGRGGGLVSTAGDIEPLGESLADFIPARVRPPGEIAGYSNYGAALASHIVEEVSGKPFDDYIEENIYGPLEMERSTFRQPLPSELILDRAVGYTYDGNGYRAHSFQYFSGIEKPAGAMTTTSTDMANFMIMHLNDGRYKNQSILQPDTAREMHRRQFTHDPRINGMCYGFFEDDLNNLSIVKHGGWTSLFYSQLLLLPDEDVGLFVSFNGGNADQNELVLAFLDHYYPAPELPVPAPMENFSERAWRFTGTYRETRTAETTLEKSAGLFMGHGMYDVRSTGDGLLFHDKRFVEMEPLFFREVGGRQTLIFREDSRGRIIYLFSSAAPHIAYIKLAWYETPQFHLMLMDICTLIFLVTFIAWPARAWFDCLKGGWSGFPLARWMAWGLSALYVLFLAGMVASFIMISSGSTSNYPNDVPTFFIFVLVLPHLAAVLTVGTLWFTVLAWKRSLWSIGGRMYYTVITVASVLFLWSLDQWNLLGFRF